MNTTSKAWSANEKKGTSPCCWLFNASVEINGAAQVDLPYSEILFYSACWPKLLTGEGDFKDPVKKNPPQWFGSWRGPLFFDL